MKAHTSKRRTTCKSNDMGNWEENVLAGVYNDPIPVSDPMEADDSYIGYVDMEADDVYEDYQDDL